VKAVRKGTLATGRIKKSAKTKLFLMPELMVTLIPFQFKHLSLHLLPRIVLSWSLLYVEKMSNF
jgi:hypothetical protein